MLSNDLHLVHGLRAGPALFLGEVLTIVKQRGESYGPPEMHWGRTAALWTALLGDRLTEPLTARDVARLYIADKLSRDTHTEQRDNLLDIAGYATGVAGLEG